MVLAGVWVVCSRAGRESPPEWSAELSGIPILLDLTGRLVIIVGGGAVAARRVTTFTQAGSIVRVIAPGVLEEISESPATIIRRRYRSGDLREAWLVVTATNDPQVNLAVAAEAAELRVFCVRADHATEGTARIPAIHTSGDLTISVNAGDDPRRAVTLRNLIAASLGDGSLPSRPIRSSVGRVSLVGGGPGDPELITVRGRRLLFEADVVVTDRLAPRSLLQLLDAGVEIIDCGKSAHRHNLTQDEINAVIVDRAQRGQRVVRFKGGDPFVFGRGGEEVQACVAAGVAVEVVPGITSAIAAPAAAGIPVTHRGLAADFAVVSGHRDPGRAEAGWNWPELAVGPATLIVLMGIDTLGEISAELIKYGRPAATPAVAVHRATLPDQIIVRSTLSGLAAAAAAAGASAPSVVIIGQVAGLKLF